MIASCPYCTKRLTASWTLYGTVVKCRSCGKKLKLPGEEGGVAEGLEWQDGKPPPTGLPEKPPAPPSPSAIANPRPTPLPPAAPRLGPPTSPRRPLLTEEELGAPIPGGESAAPFVTGKFDASNSPALPASFTAKAQLLAAAGVGGVCVALLVLVIRVISMSTASSNKESQEAALKFNDSVANADYSVYQSCRAFLDPVGQWLKGTDVPPDSLKGSHDKAKRASKEYAAKLAALTTPLSDEGREFHKRGKALAEIYQEVAYESFSEILGRVGDGKKGVPRDMERVQVILENCSRRIDDAQKAVAEAQKAFAIKNNIALTSR